MGRRVSIVAVVLLAAIQLLMPHAARTAPTVLQSSGVTAAELGVGTGIQLYQFTFDPGAWIDQQTISEPMLVYVFGGSFIFYIPAAAGKTILFRGGEAPQAVGSSDCELPPKGDELQDCTFDDVPVSNSSFTCFEDPPGFQYFECTVSDEVAILVRPGTTLVLPGPTECFVCKLDADLGVLEVAVAAPPSTFAWWIAVGQTNSVAMDPGSTARLLSVTLRDPCRGRVR